MNRPSVGPESKHCSQPQRQTREWRGNAVDGQRDTGDAQSSRTFIRHPLRLQWRASAGLMISGMCIVRQHCETKRKYRSNVAELAYATIGAEESAVHEAAVNAVSIFPTCADVKFPRGQVTVISRTCDQELHFCVGARGGEVAVPGLASEWRPWSGRAPA